MKAIWKNRHSATLGDCRLVTEPGSFAVEVVVSLVTSLTTG